MSRAAAPVIGTWSSWSAGGAGTRLLATAVVVAVAAVLAPALSALVSGRVDDLHARYHTRKLVRMAVVVVALIALAIVWRPFAGRLGIFLGLTAAGLAFAMQEVIGAVAGWFNIVSGRVFRVGDRVEMGGVKGDVIDLSPLRTTILEIGSETGDGSVKGRQHSGRIVAVSNKLSLTQPVFNYSGAFEYVWEEITLQIPYRSDWHAAERVMWEEARRTSSTQGAREAMQQMRRHYPVPRTELEPRVFVRPTTAWMELSARLVLPVRSARTEKDELLRRIADRLDAAGVEISSGPVDVALRHLPEAVGSPVRDHAEHGEPDRDRHLR